MNLKKIRLTLLVTVIACSILSLCALALPTAVTVTETAGEDYVFSEVTYALTSDGVEIEIGEKSSQTNVRFAEIDGIQTEITESNNKYNVALGEDNLLVEITEKKDKDSVETVKTQYFYVDASERTVQKLSLDSYMKSTGEKSVRANNLVGIRYMSFASKNAKSVTDTFCIEEYGYIVARTEELGSSELTFDFKNYVTGVGYNREDGTDIVFDSSNDEYDVFTGILNNIPLDKYETQLTCKTYTKIRIGEDVFTVYGEPIDGNVFETALESFEKDDTHTGVAKMVFDYYEYSKNSSADFTNTLVQSSIKDGTVMVRGRLQSATQVGKKYNAYLLTYDNYGKVVSVEKSADYTVAEGVNTFSFKLTDEYPDFQKKVFVLTENKELICLEDKQLNFVINWEPTERKFYADVTDSRYGYGTDFEGCFDQDGVSVIDGITIASTLHAKYYENEIASPEASDYYKSFDMDDASILVDLSDRNSINVDGINFTHAEGGIDETEGYLYGTSVAKDNGGYDPQIVFNGLGLDARNYNKITIRIKYANAPGYYINLRYQLLQVFFKTNTDPALSESKSIRYELKQHSNVTNWFEIELDMSTIDSWKDVITGIRIDPLNNKAKFYIDYVRFTKNEDSESSEWYDAYLDYAYENNIVKLGKYSESEFSRNLTRKEFLDMLFKAYSEEYFPAINTVKGIPDVDKNSKNAEVYLMLYNAGITLGFDDNGNLLLDEDITKSEVAAIINRLLVKENRLKGNVDSDWGNYGSEYDFEFNNASDKDLFTFTRAEVLSSDDGKLKLKSSYDSYMSYNNSINIDADRYTKIRIRVKAEYDTPPAKSSFEIFYKPKGVANFSSDYCIYTTVSDYYLDELGWYIFEVDLGLVPKWKGEVVGIRFDMMNDAGTYTYDYIRFLESEYYNMPETHEDLIAAGYTATRLMQDEDFTRGFYVGPVDQSVSSENHGLWQDYCETTAAPLWQIGPWWQGTGEGFEQTDLWEDRDTSTDEYTLSDKYGVNTIVYNPELKSITQRLNATKIYNGEPHDVDTYKWWPHQLLEQNTNYTGEVDKERNSADGDRMFVELDIRMTDFKNTTNAEGRNGCQYLIYFYLRPKSNPSQRIWFGLTLFNTSATTKDPIGLGASTNITPNWSPDSAAHQYMYGMPMAVVYDGIENSFNPSKGVAAVSDEWKHIRLDITPHIDRAIEWANRDNIFEMEVTKEDMFFNGVNIGYEIHGNYDCTFEFKNFNMVSYNKD
ncbi:MAG: hypothetical protein E7600_08460 [Ruminococcaceae bacterium]|nr:hypothetical protein [Oscillospiraceae bacterium]